MMRHLMKSGQFNCCLHWKERVGVDLGQLVGWGDMIKINCTKLSKNQR